MAQHIDLPPSPLQELQTAHPELLLGFQALLTQHSCKKKQLLHAENKVCRHSYFIHEGVARAFYFKDGKDITAHFAFEGQSITAVDSLMQGKPSKYNIEVLEDSIVFAVSYEDLETYLQQSALHERFGRYFIQQAYFEMIERVEDLQFLSAKERYHILLKKHPHIIQRVELRHISSFLGITQETLSRIRAEK